MKFHKLNSVYTLDNGLPTSKLIAGFDLDHTLIKPKDNKVHPKDKDDMELCFPNVKDKLTELITNGYDIVIFSNQSTFHKQEKQDIITTRIISFIEQIELPIYVYISTLSDHCRKPNTGMWDELFGDKSIDLAQSFYVGDAAGRNKNSQTGKKDFACSDRMFALNIGIKFYTPEKFFHPELYTKKEIYKIKKTWTTFSLEQPELDIEDYEVIILIGSPGSGKSSLFKTITGFTLVSQDELKYKSKCIKLMNDTLKSGGKVIIDNTNPKRDKRKSYIEIAQKYGKKILSVVINVTKEQSMFLVNYRCKINKTVKIPDVAIHTYFKNYEKPVKEEGFDKIIPRTFVPELDEIKKVLFEQYF
tara:strand:+ start:1763 stop:2839 length:1077 start_codon:yes stop_codon:yes gene_type:complete